MILHHRFPAWFGNREVTSLYFTIALVRFAVDLVLVFVPIYLWELGYPIWQILLFFCLESVYFVALSFAILPLLRRMSDKSMLLLSIPFFILTALSLSWLPNAAWLFYLIPAISVMKSIFFNTGYHLDFSGASDKKALGKELGLRSMVGALVSLTAPFIGAVIIGELSFQAAFYVSAALLLLAVVPLWFFPQRRVSPALTAKSVWNSIWDKRLRPHSLSNIGYANEMIAGVVVWKLFLFLSVGDIEQFGGIISISLFFSSLVTFLAGSLTDKGSRKKLLFITAMITSLIWVGRIFVTTPGQATLNHILFHLSYPALMVAWTSIFYRLAKETPRPAVFILGREIHTNISRVLFLAVLILLSLWLPLERFFDTVFLFGAVCMLFFIAANNQRLTIFRKAEEG